MQSLARKGGKFPSQLGISPELVQKRKSVFCKRSRVNYAKPHTALTIIELRPLFKEVVVPGASVARTRSVQLRDQMKPQRQFVTSVMVFYVRTGTCKHTHNKTKHHSRLSLLLLGAN
jgi:hypothetical protein